MKIFISYANEEFNFVNRLCNKLKSLSLNVAIDKEFTKRGDSIFDAINMALRDASYSIAIVSPNYIKKEWTNSEIEAIYQRYIFKKIFRIFIIYHNIEYDKIVDIYPLLSNILAFDSKEGIDFIANDIKKIIDSDKKSVDLNNSSIPTEEEAFYLILNIQEDINASNNHFLIGIIDRLSDDEKIEMLRLLAKDLIDRKKEYKDLLNDLQTRKEHRGLSITNSKDFIDFSLIDNAKVASLFGNF